MEKENRKDPWIYYESQTFRLERTIKRLWILNIILFVSFVISNFVWINYEMQYEDVVTTEIEATQDGNGVNMVGGGDVSYGTESKDQNDENP